ncbi:MAG TPA: type II toxin-antitoxin system RelE/ParE family toxin [Candidatus Limnocylindria bacterium]|jgi:plasmid stabilization system protein ParE
MPRTELTQLFRDDARRQLSILAENGEWTRIVRLAEDLLIARRRLATFPELGRELLADEDHSLRLLLLGQVPYLIWYRLDRRADAVRFVRLFHTHQQTPKPRMWLRV